MMERSLRTISAWLRSFHTTPGALVVGERYERHRPMAAEAMAALQNFYLRWVGSRVRILSRPAWRAWEKAVYENLYGLRVERIGEGLSLPYLSGQSLDELLRGSAPDELKTRAIRMAAAELRRIHGQSIQINAKTVRPFAHGDATSRNVLIDMGMGSVRWIDFETIYSGDVSHLAQRVEDLRALMRSSIESLPAGMQTEVCRAIASVYADEPDFIQMLATRFLTEGRSDLYEFAQAYVSRRVERQLGHCLEEGFRKCRQSPQHS